MLFFLSLAAEDGWTVTGCRDDASGALGKLADGRIGITGVVLQPAADYGGRRKPGRSNVERLHHAARERCFIASSVSCELEVETVSQ